MAIGHFKSPIGTIEIQAEKEGIHSIQFLNEEPEKWVEEEDPIIQKALLQLALFWSGQIQQFELPLVLKGTEFQVKVWRKLLEIPKGKTISYKELALSLGDAKLAQAVGSANGKNPVAVVVPCHRVIGNDGKLVGYASGLWRKQELLDFERSQTSLF